MAVIGDENAQLRAMQRSTFHLFDDRIGKEMKRLEALAAEQNPGRGRDEILRKIRHLDTAANINKWLSSPGLRAPSAMGKRDIYLKNAADCREKAKIDPGRADYWTDRATNWLKLATEAGGDEAITYEVRSGRMIPKSGK